MNNAMMNAMTRAMFNQMSAFAGNNPVLKNAMNLLEKGDAKGLENLARNLCNSRNINYEEALGQITSRFGK